MTAVYVEKMVDIDGGGMSGKASINDVARLARVSSQTVSRVANDSPLVRPETKERVIEAMRQLGYTPNHAARALRVGTYKTIGVIAHRFARSGEALTVESIVRAAEHADYATTLVQISEPGIEGLQQAVERLSTQGVDGVIIVRSGSVTGRDLKLPPGFPIVAADSALRGEFPTVTGDQVGGTRTAVRHLLDLGHKNVFHVSGSADATPSHDRHKAWEEALLEERIEPWPAWAGNWSAQSGYEAGQYVAQHPEITAVFCANDEMAFGLLRALHEADVQVPEDVSVVGFDSIMLSEFATPPLTTVAIDYDAMGARLFELLLQEIRGSVSRQDGEAETVLLPTKLLVRETTSAPTTTSTLAG